MNIHTKLYVFSITQWLHIRVLLFPAIHDHCHLLSDMLAFIANMEPDQTALRGAV